MELVISLPVLYVHAPYEFLGALYSSGLIHGALQYLIGFQVTNTTVNVTDRMLAVNACLPFLRDEMDKIQALSEEIVDTYIKKFTDVKDHLQMYNDSLRLDGNFYKSANKGVNNCTINCRHHLHVL